MAPGVRGEVTFPVFAGSWPWCCIPCCHVCDQGEQQPCWFVVTFSGLSPLADHLGISWTNRTAKINERPFYLFKADFTSTTGTCSWIGAACDPDDPYIPESWNTVRFEKIYVLEDGELQPYLLVTVVAFCPGGGGAALVWGANMNEMDCLDGQEFQFLGIANSCPAGFNVGADPVLDNTDYWKRITSAGGTATVKRVTAGWANIISPFCVTTDFHVWPNGDPQGCTEEPCLAFIIDSTSNLSANYKATFPNPYVGECQPADFPLGCFQNNPSCMGASSTIQAHDPVECEFTVGQVTFRVTYAVMGCVLWLATYSRCLDGTWYEAGDVGFPEADGFYHARVQVDVTGESTDPGSYPAFSGYVLYSATQADRWTSGNLSNLELGFESASDQVPVWAQNVFDDLYVKLVAI